MPSVSSTPPSGRVRRAQSAYVTRSRPAAVAVTTPLCPKFCSARSNKVVIESGTSCISPCMAGRLGPAGDDPGTAPDVANDAPSG